MRLNEKKDNIINGPIIPSCKLSTFYQLRIVITNVDND